LFKRAQRRRSHATKEKNSHSAAVSDTVSP